jgi:hypothetical protein
VQKEANQHRSFAMAKLAALMLISALLPALIYTMSIPSGYLIHNEVVKFFKFNLLQFGLNRDLWSKIFTLKMI